MDGVKAIIVDHETRRKKSQDPRRPRRVPLVVGTGPHAWAADRRVEFRLSPATCGLSCVKGHPLDDQGRLLGAHRGSDDGRAIDPAAGR